MSSTYTTNAGLNKPATSDRYWDVALNANADLLDSISAIGQLMITPTEIPSATLNVRVSPGTFVKGDGTFGALSGSNSIVLAASQTVRVWLTDAGVLTSGSAFPTTAHVRLAVVVTGATAIQSITDAKVVTQTAGSGLGFVLKGGDTMTGTFSVAPTATSTATFTANPSTGSIGFFGAALQPQAAAVASLVDSTTGTAGNTLADVGSTHSQSILDNNFASLAAKVNALITAMKRHGLMSN